MVSPFVDGSTVTEPHGFWDGGKQIVLLALVPWMLLSCCGASAKKPSPPHLRSEVVTGDNYALAIYNSENLLTTRPLQRLFDCIDEGGSAAGGRKRRSFTDIIFVSHGWNFTVDEAISNYSKYQEAAKRLFDTELSDEAKKSFRPYFIFVAWSAVSRPLTEGSRSLLPFGLDESVSLFTKIGDMTVFHLLSSWKQSVNASSNALGYRYPDTYHDRAYDAERITDFEWFLETKGGYDIPVSALMYHLLAKNENGELSADGKPLRVHCIGHSFGAKLISLATIEALRRFTCCPPPGRAAKALEAGRRPIESLLLFNPAFQASELVYIRELHTPLMVNPKEYLDRIPRKAMVYSHRDYATGGLFDISQIILSNANSQYTQQIGNDFQATTGDHGLEFLSVPFNLATSGLQLGAGNVFGALRWMARRVWNTPFDFWYHLRHNNTFAFMRSEDSKLLDRSLMPVRLVLNGAHYFAPLNHLVWWGAPADQLGILRPSNPALGRTGLVRHGRGRVNLRLRYVIGDAFSNTSPLEDYATEDNEVAALEFARMAATVPCGGKTEYRDPERFYSFDASLLFDSCWPPSGSHGDLRSGDTVALPPELDGDSKETRKVDATLRFIYNFIQHGRESE